ncbi:uncharacterized protein BDZ83DRAFT_733068 [Colletotrichum acutatum]|uniref:Uncharacterized protein n=1 Tax=Glomerella acutata TaxID=27357 RepID=A0AAD8XEK0_GLOAC|nr:uncharacterized protein BDZ83DRAFT_733068 [Colletotrichum acutatum]KAK1720372.1 hypothetical protein BDZ83DRAFT_733068 [Colletotrichum acutatum]
MLGDNPALHHTALTHPARLLTGPPIDRWLCKGVTDVKRWELLATTVSRPQALEKGPDPEISLHLPAGSFDISKSCVDDGSLEHRMSQEAPRGKATCDDLLSPNIFSHETGVLLVTISNLAWSKAASDHRMGKNNVQSFLQGGVWPRGSTFVIDNHARAKPYRSQLETPGFYVSNGLS